MSNHQRVFICCLLLLALVQVALMVRIDKQELSPQLLRNLGYARSDVSGSQSTSVSGEEGKSATGGDIDLHGPLGAGSGTSANVH